MSNIIRYVRKSRASAELIILTVAVALAALAIAYYYGSNKQHYEKYGIGDDEVRFIKEHVPLVIVGTIVKKHQQVRSQARGALQQSGVSYFKMNVEAVERGVYPGDTIDVVIGWFSNYSAPQIYPPFLKKDYYTGDRIRIFLDYDEEEGEYYTPALWYTIEPAS